MVFAGLAFFFPLRPHTFTLLLVSCSGKRHDTAVAVEDTGVPLICVDTAKRLLLIGSFLLGRADLHCGIGCFYRFGSFHGKTSTIASVCFL